MEANVDNHLLNTLEDGIHVFGNRMANVNREIEQRIDLYFQDFERGLQILVERLRKAECDLERAEEALERQRKKRIRVKDDDGDGYHYEPADCSAQEEAVARCESICCQCRNDVNQCNQMIDDARAKAHYHREKYATLENEISISVDKLCLIKERINAHLAIEVPKISLDTASSASTKSSGHASGRGDSINWTRQYAEQLARPRSPRVDNPRPANSRPVTEADRPRSPFEHEGRVVRSKVPSFAAGIEEILKKYRN
ncbi:MAG: hypothetical protein KBT15_07445 [Bacteroidales bacterium]|nr:hypothetical protein [Candidatus Minthousia equi]